MSWLKTAQAWLIPSPSALAPISFPDDSVLSRANPHLSGAEPASLRGVFIAVLALIAVVQCTALISYNPQDPSWNCIPFADTSSQNALGYAGAIWADIHMQLLGPAAFVVPLFFFLACLPGLWISSFLSLTVFAYGAAWGWEQAFVRTALVDCGLHASWGLMIGGLSGLLALRGPLGLAQALKSVRFKSLARFWPFVRTTPSAPTEQTAVAVSYPPLQEPAPSFPYQAEISHAEASLAMAMQYKNSTPSGWANDGPHAPPVVPQAQPPSVKQSLPSGLMPPAKLTIPSAISAGLARPPMDLLDSVPPPTHHVGLSQELRVSQEKLQAVLKEFGVRGQVVGTRPGPVVSLYEFEPAAGVKSARVINLAEDIARSMSAISARVAVIPGKNLMGIEIPNAHRETVCFREMLAAQDYQQFQGHLPLALGKDIAGAPVIADLARMPHLLIAGTTGSGKSVGVNGMILSILFKLSPRQCRFLMIDPKILELSHYNGIPHLLTPVVTDPAKAVTALKWVLREMERRYRQMALHHVRNIESYNNVMTKAAAPGTEPDILPFIVVIVDEMADLMMVAGKDIENAVQRLAQMARAAGIHLIMATQRPSVDVITGTIKANFPTRISFQVTSKFDSRTILGEQGAELLLRHGDMLYMSGGRIVRLHGPFVSDREVEQVVAFLSQQPTEYIDDITVEESDPSATAAGVDPGDDLYQRALEIIRRDRKPSISYLQRRLQIGYNRAATLMEQLEEEGVVSSVNHIGRRDILIG